MSAVHRILSALLVLAAILPAIAIGNNAAARASDSPGGDLWEMADCAFLVGVRCFDVQDAASWAERVTAWKFPGPAWNNQGDAFRHCAWMGALSTRVGIDAAIGVGEIHEKHNPGPESERLMDLSNNETGAWIGNEALLSGTSDTWGYVMNHCEQLAKDGRLAGLDGIPGNWQE